MKSAPRRAIARRASVCTPSANAHWNGSLRRGRDDGSFPLADPERDAVAISAVVSRELTISAPGDAEELQRARARVLDFALRALGAERGRPLDEFRRAAESVFEKQP